MHPCPLGNDDACPMGLRCYAGVTCDVVVVDEDDDEGDGKNAMTTFEGRHGMMESTAIRRASSRRGRECGDSSSYESSRLGRWDDGADANATMDDTTIIADGGPSSSSPSLANAPTNDVADAPSSSSSFDGRQVDVVIVVVNDDGIGNSMKNASRGDDDDDERDRATLESSSSSSSSSSSREGYIVSESYHMYGLGYGWN